MAARTIRSGFGTYQRADGQWSFGWLGETVDVHEGDLERFDRLNPAAPESTPEPAETAFDEGIYKRVSVKDLKADLAARNEDRGEDDQIVPAEPGNRPEIIAALIADDEK